MAYNVSILRPTSWLAKTNAPELQFCKGEFARAQTKTLCRPVDFYILMFFGALAATYPLDYSSICLFAWTYFSSSAGVCQAANPPSLPPHPLLGGPRKPRGNTGATGDHGEPQEPLATKGNHGAPRGVRNHGSPGHHRHAPGHPPHAPGHPWPNAAGAQKRAPK